MIIQIAVSLMNNWFA